MTRKTMIAVLVVLGGLFFIYKLADLFSPGSYGQAEEYELHFTEEKVIEAIKKLKEQDKDLVLPKVTIVNTGPFDVPDGRQEEIDNWYAFYFYDKDENRILFTWTRPSGKNTTIFALVSINEGLDLGHWKDVNKDFGFFENRRIKRNFEETILKRLKENLADE
jgi:hypothetical protein